jgi:AbrB family looped-hinge helix DNA binding protein
MLWMRLDKCLTTSYLETCFTAFEIMDTTKLSSKGQVVLPKSVRDQHGWGEGTEFVVESTAHGVLLRPRQAFPATRIDGVFGSLPYRGKPKSLSDFDAGIRREVRRRHGRT